MGNPFKTENDAFKKSFHETIYPNIYFALFQQLARHLSQNVMMTSTAQSKNCFQKLFLRLHPVVISLAQPLPSKQ